MSPQASWILRLLAATVTSLVLSGCSTEESDDQRTAPTETDTTEGTLEESEAALPLRSASSSGVPASRCLQDLTGKPNAQKICAKIAEAQAKYAGRDITVLAVAAISAGGLGGYVIYDTSDLQAAALARTKPVPLEKQSYVTETAAWDAYGVAAAGLYVRDASTPPQEGYAYAALAYGPTGGVFTARVSGPSAGTRTLLIPFAW